MHNSLNSWIASARHNINGRELPRRISAIEHVYFHNVRIGKAIFWYDSILHKSYHTNLTMKAVAPAKTITYTCQIYTSAVGIREMTARALQRLVGSWSLRQWMCQGPPTITCASCMFS